MQHEVDDPRAAASEVVEDEAGNGVESLEGHFTDSSNHLSKATLPPAGTARFHEELRRRNLRILLWTNLLFNPALLLWSVFDYYLVPEFWSYFLLLRVAGVVLNFTVLAVLQRFALQRYSWEGMWLLVFVLCAVISLMLPLSGDSLPRYVMGFAVVVFGAGVIPIWPPRWGLSVLVAAVLFAVWVLVGEGSQGLVARDVIGSAFVVVTAVGLSSVATFFKYDLVRSDFESREELAAVAKREAQANRRLEAASRELHDALERLKELDRLKSKFFANISHELRTPLTLILAPLSELEDGRQNEETRWHVRIIRRNAERLLGLIDDLLDLSRLDAGGLRLNLAEIDMRTIAVAVYENSRPAAIAMGIESKLIVDSSERKVLGDSHRLEMVLTNLMSNAIKFTQLGGRIGMKVADDIDGVRVEVEDDGIGIPAEDLSRVFERFFQVGASDRRRGGGVGIGLALAKELVELHGGRISVESQEGEFTRFSVKIPFGREHIRPDVIERRSSAEATASRKRRSDDSGGSHDLMIVGAPAEEAQVAVSGRTEEYLFGGVRRANILLVEDQVEVRDFIGALVRPYYNVEMVVDGTQAIEALRQRPPDLVVSDIMMPGMSGTDLCRLIKDDDELRDIPVILLTARVGSEATLEAYAHGADDFVAKPFHPRVLMARIRAQLKLRDLGLRLAEREKLAVVGTLAAGILHEVRNPVNAILNAARLISSGQIGPEVENELVQIIEDGASRIQDITEALDAHARPAEAGEPRPYDVTEGIEATLRLLQHRMKGMHVYRDYVSQRLVVASAGPLNQVFLNLLDNALRAGSTSLWIQVTDSEERLQIRVADDGPGLPTRDAERVFDPFYTTRKDGSGTGLGLYLSRRLVTDQGGSLWYEPRPGGGAIFVVELPCENRNITTH
jgi:signal transduction histidine kinase